MTLEDIVTAFYQPIYHILVMLDNIYIPFANCSLVEALLGMVLIGQVLTLLTPWVYFDEGEDI